MYNLDGQIAIVTGAGSGLGRAIALRLSQEGATIAATDLNGEAVKKLVGEIKDQKRSGLSIQMDVSIEKDVERAVKQTLENFGQIDILVNNAGVGSAGLIINHSEEDWDKAMRVNLKGTFLCSRAVAKEMVIRATAREHKKVPFRFTRMALSQSSSEWLMISPALPTPALLTRMSIWPKFSKVCLTARSTSFSMETSICIERPDLF